MKDFGEFGKFLEGFETTTKTGQAEQSTEHIPATIEYLNAKLEETKTQFNANLYSDGNLYERLEFLEEMIWELEKKIKQS